MSETQSDIRTARTVARLLAEAFRQYGGRAYVDVADPEYALIDGRFDLLMIANYILPRLKSP